MQLLSGISKAEQVCSMLRFAYEVYRWLSGVKGRALVMFL